MQNVPTYLHPKNLFSLSYNRNGNVPGVCCPWKNPIFQQLNAGFLLSGSNQCSSIPHIFYKDNMKGREKCFPIAEILSIYLLIIDESLIHLSYLQRTHWPSAENIASCIFGLGGKKF